MFQSPPLRIFKALNLDSDHNCRILEAALTLTLGRIFMFLHLIAL